MKKIISFLLLAAMLVGCMVPAVIVSAADVALSVANVEKVQGTGVEVAPELSIANNPGLTFAKLVVYYNAAEFSIGDTDAFASSPFSAAESYISNEFDGTNRNVRDFIPAELQATSKAFILELCAAPGEVVDVNGAIAAIPLQILVSEFGSYTFNVVVAEAFDADDEEVVIADTTGTVTFVADPLIGIYDEFTVFMNPGDVDVVVGTETIDVQIRYDNNPGLWSTRIFIAYPDALTLSNGTSADIENSYAIFEAADALMVGLADLPLDDPRQVGQFQDIMNSDPNFVKEGYHSTNVYFEAPGPEDTVYGDGVLCTLHFKIDPSVEVGDVLDIKMYYGEADFLYAGTDENGDAEFISYYPPVYGANLTIIEKVCEHTATTEEHLDATCGADGYDRVVCDECGEILSETVIPATGEHTEGDPVIVESTCTTAGTSTVYCTVCNEVLSETALDLADHTPGAAATCQAAQTCTVCGVELAAKLDHVEGEPTVVAPTCSEDGKNIYNCADCGEFIREEVIPATGHTYLQPNNSVVTPPTCTEDGYTTRYCDVCGEPNVSDIVPAYGHDEDGGSTTVESTCTVAGSVTYYCSCGEVVRVEELPLAAHALVAHDAVEAGCHTAGAIAYWECSECGALFSDADATEEITEDDIAVPADNELIHFEEAPACHADGFAEHWYCVGCDTYYTDANGENAVEADDLVIPADCEAKHVEAVAATCTENGCAEYWYCEECDTFFADAECKYNVAYLSLTILANGHNYEDGVCTVCGDKEVVEDKEEADKNDTDKAPVTGDSFIVIACVLAAVLVVGTVSVVVIRRRRAN